MALPKQEIQQTKAAQSIQEYLQAFFTTLWQDVLTCRDTPALDTTFYDAGGHSILLSSLRKKILLHYPESGFLLLDVFYNPTIRRQAAHLSQLLGDSMPVSSSPSDGSPNPFPASATASSRSSVVGVPLSDEKPSAIVGMTGRFPGANSVGEMFDLVIEKKHALRHLMKQELTRPVWLETKYLCHVMVPLMDWKISRQVSGQCQMASLAIWILR